MEKIVINQPVVQIMEKPSSDSMVTDEIFYGMEVCIKNALYNGWFLIHTYYGYEGYIKKDSVISVDTGCERSEFVTASFAAVYMRPDVKASVMLTLVRGAIVTVLIRESNGYTEVQLYDGRVGYIKTSALTAYIESSPKTQEKWLQKNESCIRGQIVSYAMSYLGTPYRYGGKSPMGIDCSGLSFMAYLLSGVCIWRDSQMKEGYAIHEITKRQLMPADLIYFPGHVAIYLGEERFIHATDRIGIEQVAVQSLNPEDEEFRRDLAGNIVAYGSVWDV